MITDFNLGTEDSPNNLTFSLSPNPVVKSINVRVEDAKTPYSLQLVNLEGKVLLTMNQIVDPSFDLDLSNYDSGTYLLNIISQGGKLISERVIKVN